MKGLGWLTGCALALSCAHEGKGVVGERSDTKMQGTVAEEASQPQAASTASGNFAACAVDSTIFGIFESGVSRSATASATAV